MQWKNKAQLEFLAGDVTILGPKNKMEMMQNIPAAIIAIGAP